ncbi:MAG: hypothetical protein WED00_00020 [Aquisalimonadaceae bacterium]
MSVLLPVLCIPILIAFHHRMLGATVAVILPLVVVYLSRGAGKTLGLGQRPSYARLSTSDGWFWDLSRRDTGVTERWMLVDWYRTRWLVVLYLGKRKARRRTTLLLPRDAANATAHRRLRALLGGIGHAPPQDSGRQ